MTPRPQVVTLHPPQPIPRWIGCEPGSLSRLTFSARTCPTLASPATCPSTRAVAHAIHLPRK